MPKKVRVGMVGAGFAADFHLASYKRIQGLEVEIAAIASRTENKARAMAERFDIACVYPDFDTLVAHESIDIVDLCVPVNLHKPMIIEASNRGKHVICEKPLLGFMGDGHIPRIEMYQQVVADLDEVRETVRRNGTKLLYAENWIYAPPIQKAAALVKASKGTILGIRGWESHSGSASEFSKQWRYSGGGALLRLGIHPLSASIYLKNMEGGTRCGKPIKVTAVYGQIADLTQVPSFKEEERKWLATGWQDVENWSIGILTFEDGTMAIISASDIALGGIENGIELYLSNSHIKCNMDPNTMCQAYAPHPSIFGQEFIAEKLETRSGWMYPSIDHHWMSGYPQELQDFVEAVVEDHEPLSGLELATQAITVAYALYVSAEQGRRLMLSEL